MASVAQHDSSVMKSLRREGGGHTRTVSGFPFLGWDSGKRQKKLLLINNISKLPSGKTPLSGLLLLFVCFVFFTNCSGETETEGEEDTPPSWQHDTSRGNNCCLLKFDM